MTHALCLRVQGPGEQDALAALERFFGTRGDLALRPVVPEAAPAFESRGVSKGFAEQRERLYAITKEIRDWGAAAATVGAFVWLFVPNAPAPPPAADAPSDVAVRLEQVKAATELLREIGTLNATLDFTLELVDPDTGAFLRLDKHAAPAEVVAFCRKARQPAPPR